MCTISKQHLPDPTAENHSIYFKDEELRTHLSITGIMSYFSVRKPTTEDLRELESLDLTPDLPSWDPCDVKYERREDVMLDFEGNVISKSDRITILDDEVDIGDSVELEDLYFGVDIAPLSRVIAPQTVREPERFRWKTLWLKNKQHQT